MKIIDVIARLLEGLLYAINQKRKKEATDNPADTIANGGGVQQSDQSFSDLADKSKRD